MSVDEGSSEVEVREVEVRVRVRERDEVEGAVASVSVSVVVRVVVRSPREVREREVDVVVVSSCDGSQSEESGYAKSESRIVSRSVMLAMSERSGILYSGLSVVTGMS